MRPKLSSYFLSAMSDWCFFELDYSDRAAECAN